ncbi:NUDIX hydrolase [Paenibacillus alvei]|uniref:NUDIX hydrolase n=2 Tax=Paenibacillus TaxID=44249 RepID=A0ABT4H5Y2_PAEAL|nr:NUDIX hydrolase [Paenibacillus alvei]MCY7486918.1 NUDIX hydrolase [Paenibacillus alvei]MCY9764392.1 NUDIX hydrolase [Paenibacillus alvei]MCY9766890.1 NUDIX hydrolase [Paenibacillus alvei]
MFFVNSRAIIERNFNNERQIVIQTRNKPHEPLKIELPGGRIEPYESLTQALRREVREETGLEVTEIEGEDTRIDTTGIDPEFEVECMKPFGAYQTIRGPIDSVGYYFRCKAEGEIVQSGDETTDIKWISIKELSDLINSNPLQFSNVDRAGIIYYLKQLERS